jgi:hypothetical protein
MTTALLLVLCLSATGDDDAAEVARLQKVLAKTQGEAARAEKSLAAARRTISNLRTENERLEKLLEKKPTASIPRDHVIRREDSELVAQFFDGLPKQLSQQGFNDEGEAAIVKSLHEAMESWLKTNESAVKGQLFDSARAVLAKSVKKNVQKEASGDINPVVLDDMKFTVGKSQWAFSLPRSFLFDGKPRNRFLCVYLTVENVGVKPDSVHRPRLVDSEGAEYESIHPTGWDKEIDIGLFDSINPRDNVSGYVVFDVRPDRSYSLKVQVSVMGSARLVRLGG